MLKNGSRGPADLVLIPLRIPVVVLGVVWLSPAPSSGAGLHHCGKGFYRHLDVRDVGFVRVTSVLLGEGFDVQHGPVELGWGRARPHQTLPTALSEGVPVQVGGHDVREDHPSIDLTPPVDPTKRVVGQVVDPMEQPEVVPNAAVIGRERLVRSDVPLEGTSVGNARGHREPYKSWCQGVKSTR